MLFPGSGWRPGHCGRRCARMSLRGPRCCLRARSPLWLELMEMGTRGSSCPGARLPGWPPPVRAMCWPACWARCWRSRTTCCPTIRLWFRRSPRPPRICMGLPARWPAGRSSADGIVRICMGMRARLRRARSGIRLLPVMSSRLFPGFWQAAPLTVSWRVIPLISMLRACPPFRAGGIRSSRARLVPRPRRWPGPPMRSS